MPISQILPDGKVRIYNKKTGETADVAPEQLGKYDPTLVGSYQNIITARDAVKSGQVKTSDLPDAQKPLVGSALTAAGYSPEQAAKVSAASQARHDNIQTALSSLVASEQNLVSGGGAQGPLGASAKIPFVGQYLNPSGAAYQKTKIETATQLAKAITNSARPGQQVIDAYMHSLPDVADNPEFAKQKIDLLRNQINAQAKSFGYKDLVTEPGATDSTIQPQQKQSGNPILDGINNNGILKALLGYAANTAGDIGSGLAGNSQDSINAHQAQLEAQAQAQLAQKKAQTVKDPQEAKRLLAVAGKTFTQNSQNAGAEAGGYSPDVKDNPYLRALLASTQVATTASLPTDAAMVAGGVKQLATHPIASAKTVGNVVKTGVGAVQDPIGALQAAGVFLKNDATNGSFKLTPPKYPFAQTVASKGTQQAAQSEQAPLAQSVGTSLKHNVRQIELPPSIYGHGREEAVNATLDKYGFTGDARNQYAMLQPTVDKLGTQITDIMAKNPKSASIDTIVKDFDKNLSKRGVYRTQQLSKDTAQKEARSYIRDLYVSAGEGDSKVVPQTIPDQALYQLKQEVNRDYQGVAKKLDNGTPLTDREKVISVARQTLDDTLASMHTDVKALTTEQSHLYDAVKSLHKARNAKGTIAKIFGTEITVPTRVHQRGKDLLGRVLTR